MNIEELRQLAIEAEENKKTYYNNKKQQKNQQEKFSPNSIKASLNNLVADTRLSRFQQATQEIKTLYYENTLQIEQEMEGK